nr:PAS domain-containing protein [Parafrankia soli]
MPEWLDLQIRDRALQATGACFTITDPRQPDNPLIWANPAFERVTGYSLAEVVGRNCRFLQNGDDDQPALAELRAGLAAGRHVVVVLRNYRRDGTPFWNELAISPVFDPLGEITHFVGVQTDVTERVEAQLERDRLFERERAARGDAERATAQLQLLADVSELLSGTLDVGEALDRLTKAVVPTAADWCAVGERRPPTAAPAHSGRAGPPAGFHRRAAHWHPGRLPPGPLHRRAGRVPGSRPGRRPRAAAAHRGEARPRGRARGPGGSDRRPDAHRPAPGRRRRDPRPAGARRARLRPAEPG